MFDDDDEAEGGDEQLSNERRDSIKRYEEMVQKKEDYFFDVDALNHLIDHYFEQGELSKALDVSRYALKLHPAQFDFMLRESSLLAKTGNEISALEKLKKYELMSPDDPDLHLIRANIYSAMGDFIKAIENYHIAIRYSDQVAPIYHDLSYAYADAGDYDNAIKYMKKFLQSGWQDTFAYDQLINWLLAANRLQEGLSFLEEQIDADPYSDASWLAYAMVCKEMKLYDKALSGLDYCLVIAPDNIQAYLEQGDVYFLLENYNEAINSYQNSMEYFPNNAITFYNIGECYEHLNEFEQAREYYAKSIRLYPDLAAAWYSIGMVLSYQEKFYEAIHYLKKAVELEAQNAEFWFALADCESSLNHFNETIACYENVVELDPGNEDIWAEYSLFLFENNQVDDALDIINEGIRTLPEQAELYYYYFCFLYAAGKLEEAYLELASALVKDYNLHPVIFEVIPDLKENDNVIELIKSYENK
ncbi:MAG: tetratricopeptide repeat protein [Bacteroidia bacterium]